MTGVEILATEEVAETFGWSWPVFLIIFGIVVIFTTVFAGISCRTELGNGSFLFGATIGILMGALLGSVCASKANAMGYETQYKVIIDNSVSMNEFNEKYEIIDQEGKIYTVRERE